MDYFFVIVIFSVIQWENFFLLEDHALEPA